MSERFVDPFQHLNCHADDLPGARLAELHHHQLGRERRVVPGHSDHEPDPAPGQRLGRIAFGRQRLLHGNADLVNEPGPRRIRRGHRIRPGRQQRIEFVVIKVLLVHVHQLQSVQPIGRRGLAARRDHVNDILQVTTEALRARCLRVERRDLTLQKLPRNVGGLIIEAGLDVLQRISERFQSLNTMQPDQIIPTIQACTAVAALRRRQKPDCVIVMQGADAQPRLLRQFADF